MNALARRLQGRSHINLLLQWRWLVLVIAVPFSLVVEFLEGQSHDLMFLDEVFVDGLVLPISTWIVLTFVASRVAAQQERQQTLEQQQQFGQRLADARSFNELAQFLVSYPAVLLPVERASLFLHRHDNQRLELVATWDNGHLDLGPLAAPRQREQRFVLLANNAQVGLLFVRFQPDAVPDQKKLAMLTALVPEMARALARSIADSEQQEQIYRAAQAHERRRLTQELHDSLAQQVFYLHLGLDQLSDDTALVASEASRRKIAAMRDVAAEVYDQIRNNLSILRAWEQVNLSEAISELARITAYNADMVIAIDVQGQPEWLSPHTCEHVYSMVREALHNVVKHAGAREVRLELAWTPEELGILLADNGVGFAADEQPAEGHYGLILMRETVEALHGDLVIDSAPGAGTRLHISIPLRRGSPYRLNKPAPHYDSQSLLDVAQ